MFCIVGSFNPLKIHIIIPHCVQNKSEKRKKGQYIVNVMCQHDVSYVFDNCWA